MGKSFEQNNFHEKIEDTEESVIAALKQEKSGMEERQPNKRKDGEGDPKYEVLSMFIEIAEEKGFVEAYNSLKDYEKYAVITRLENQAYYGKISYDFVEKFRKELYGTITDASGDEFINYEKMDQLSEDLFEKWKQSKER